MTLAEFALEMCTALGLGLLIGVERELGRHPAGLRTNALVSLGAAMFVSVSSLVVDDSPTRIAAQVVCGIGFLGGGAILREGVTIKGMTTAATLWCSAAVGVLAGTGHAIHALVTTALILVTNVFLHPVSKWIDQFSKKRTDLETAYRLHVICTQADEHRIRAVVADQINAQASMGIRRISTQYAEDPSKALIVAEVVSSVHDERALQEIVSRLGEEPSTTSVSWERLQ